MDSSGYIINEVRNGMQNQRDEDQAGMGWTLPCSTVRRSAFGENYFGQYT